jgi:hypothetical protein
LSTSRAASRRERLIERHAAGVSRKPGKSPLPGVSRNAAAAVWVSVVSPLKALPEPAEPQWTTAQDDPAEPVRALQDERTRLLARAVGDHLPYELALRVEELERQLGDLRAVL